MFRPFLLVGLSVLVVFASLIPAQVSANRTGLYCVVEVDPIQFGHKYSASRDMGCFATSSEAIFVATGGAVQLPDDVPASSPYVRWAIEFSNARSAVLAEKAEGSQSFVIAKDWTGVNYTGDYYVIATRDVRLCDGGISYGSEYPSVWKNSIRSSEAFGCRSHTIYGNDDGYLTNSQPNIGCFINCSTLGSMNGKNRSWRSTL